jgi:hypothetical protein
LELKVQDQSIVEESLDVKWDLDPVGYAVIAVGNLNGNVEEFVVIGMNGESHRVR